MIDEDPGIQYTSPVEFGGEAFDAYRAPQSDIEYLTPDIHITEKSSPTPPPRVWPAIVAGIGTLPLSFVISLTVLLICMFASLNPAQMRNPGYLQAWLSDFTTSKLGIIVLSLPGQLTFLGVACLGAWLSPTPFRERLKLVPGTMPVWTWPLLALSCPGMGALSSLVMSLFFDEAGEALEMLENMFRSAHGWFLVVLLGLVAVLPGLSEEGLFRGYVQSRLLQRMPAWGAIGLSSVLFSIAHLDPLHVLAVFPLGVWLGIIAWRCNSIWPGVMGHMVNNAISIVMTHYSNAKGFEFEADGPSIALVVVSGTALVASVALLVVHRPKEPKLRTAY
jgi:membrane protease YdiL (CAAX protease family)